VNDVTRKNVSVNVRDVFEGTSVKFLGEIEEIFRSRWQRDLRHELSLLARTLGSWVRIPLKA
jgi:hypothetical protein